MMDSSRRVRVYTVVDVWRGMANDCKSFSRLKDAREYARRLERCRNPQSDDVGLFAGALRLAPVPTRARAKRSS